MRKYFLLLIIFSYSCSSCNSAPGSNSNVDTPTDSVRTIKSGLNYPWEILWGKDDHIWMTERGGRISKIDPKTGTTVFYSTIAEVIANNEGGMLGMVQHPDFLNNGLFYVVYNYRSSGNYLEKMVQMKYENGNMHPVKTLIQNIPAASNHDGSRLLISAGTDPKLFMTTGDATEKNNAQNTSSLSGKVLRFNLDGSIPADNPFPNSPVWSYGHRNQQGLVMVNGILYASEHGPTVEDEVNIIENNRNYGWPNVNGSCDQVDEISFCSVANVKEPIWSSGSSTIAVCGLDYYGSNKIPAWKNCLLMLTLKDASLRALKLNADGKGIASQQTYFKNRFGRLRDICISPAGNVYICTSNGSNGDVLLEISKL
ncbi:MAG: PQQ-dependent sugar dehydrogenase [Chitinophagaceae bacterium]|nr:PQQ-dependent sugar dehydrogenase [Chitinophagaceae bacterium]